MFSRMLQWSAALVFGVLVAGPANAATVPLNDPTGGTTYTANTTDLFVANPAPFGTKEQIDHYYTFTGLDSLQGTADVTVHVSFPGGSSPGIDNLFVKWLDSTQTIVLASIQLTNGSGQTIASTLQYTFTLVNDAVLYLTGKSNLNAGAQYDVTLRFSGDGQNEVPLPPALILFGSALVGLTVLGRRKRQGAKV
jgi:hypothetical protein